MNPPIPLWQAWPSEDLPNLLPQYFGKVPEWPSALHKRSMASDWAPVSAIWHPSAKGDTPEISLLALNEICMTDRTAKLLFESDFHQLEWLDVNVGGEVWQLLNCLRRSCQFDPQTSVFDWFDFIPLLPALARIRWINITDPRVAEMGVFAFSYHASTLPHLYHLLWADALVKRIKNLGLRGVEFEQVGYIVSDASEAIPMPPPPPPPQARKRKGHQLSTQPLHKEDMAELAQAGTSLRATLQITAHTDAPAVLDALTERVTRLRYGWPHADARTRTQTLLGLSAIYGDLLCAAQGWTWIELRQGRKQSWPAVASADGQYALALMPFMDMQVMSEAPTLTLLFNMIAAGHLPPAEPGRIALVG